MTADRIVMIGCAALLVVSVFANQREGAQEQSSGAQRESATDEIVRDPKREPASPPTHTTQLATLMDEGCIEWDDPMSERRMMTCGDTVPAVQVVSYQRRYVP